MDDAAASFIIGPRGPPYLENARHSAYDVHPDGQRFIFITGDRDDSGELVLVQSVMAASRSRSEPATRQRGAR